MILFNFGVYFNNRICGNSAKYDILLKVSSRAFFGLIFWGITFLSSVCLAQKSGAVYVVTVAQAAVYFSPDEGKRSSTFLNRGRRVEAAGEVSKGFLPILIRSGGKAWVRESEVVSELPANEFLEPVEPKSNGPSKRGRQRQKERSFLGLERVTFDLGASSGSTNSVSYTELNLGLNAYFYEWLAWRNAIFGRFMTGSSGVYGLDSSLRGIIEASGFMGFTAFAGPGYRFVNQGRGAPFFETGIVLKLAGLALGGGVKTVLTSWAQSGAPNETQYFIILAGGGSL